MTTVRKLEKQTSAMTKESAQNIFFCHVTCTYAEHVEQAFGQDVDGVPSDVIVLKSTGPTIKEWYEGFEELRSIRHAFALVFARANGEPPIMLFSDSAPEKMMLDPMGGIILTYDGNVILREIDVAHPTAKNMIELSRTQDEECGDVTTSVIVLAGLYAEMMTTGWISKPRSGSSPESPFRSTRATIRRCSHSSKPRSGPISADDAGVRTVDIKRYARVEKVPGGEIESSRVLSGVMLNKDIVHPQMRRRIHKPRIVLLDCQLEYRKGESQTNIEISKEADFARINQIEEELVKVMVDRILEFKPDLVITEKGISDYAQYFFAKANVSALRRVRKSDNNRIARAVGATIVNRVEDLRESDIGTRCGLFNIEKIGDEYFTFLTECTTPKACTILLRGPSKDILNEIDRNLADAMSVARNVVFNPTLVPGGGAVEMAILVGLHARARAVTGVEAGPFRAVADALEAKHANGEHSWGIDGETGDIVDMKTYKLYESASVKIQTFKTAIEVLLLYSHSFIPALLLTIYLFCFATRKKRQQEQGPPPEELAQEL
ncbi:T-complex protein 1 [Russula emetica]|nr:T-complex protein 1 [Russula emetica]